MQSTLKNALAALYLRSPLLPEKRWQESLAHFHPILKNVFRESPCPYVLTMRVLDAMQQGKPRLTARRLDKLRPYCRDGGDPEKALYHILTGLHYEMLGNASEMARYMRAAAKFGHSFHLPHALLSNHYLFNRARYDMAVQEAEEGINCVYRYPLDEEKRRFVAVWYADEALALTMMHRLDEAEDILQKAASAKDHPHCLHALTILRAVQGRHDEAEAAFAALKATGSPRAAHAEANLPLLLAGNHPHFVAKTIDLDALRDYWAWFREEERTLLRIAESQGHDACHEYHNQYFKVFAPEPAEVDMIQTGIKRVDGLPQMLFRACYSRSSDALITALIDTCPKDIASRWRILREP